MTRRRIDQARSRARPHTYTSDLALRDSKYFKVIFSSPDRPEGKCTLGSRLRIDLNVIFMFIAFHR